MRKIFHFGVLWLGLTFAVASLLGQATQEGAGRGAVIIAAKEGPTRFLDPQGQVLPAEKSAMGATLPEGYVAQAGIGGKIVLLLSNGTVMTLGSQTKLKIREFTQEPFDARGRKVSDLKEEPSKSNVKLDLDWGSLVVATKKLNRESSLDISSSAGTAGIRGTQLQMSQNPGSGVKLDVSESTATVAFKPPGDAQPMVVAPGQGLDVSAAGVTTPRPINPVAAQNITATNNAAVQATGDVSLNAVSDAMTEATAEAAEAEAGGGDGDGDGGDGGDGDGDGGGDGDGDGDGGGDGDGDGAGDGDGGDAGGGDGGDAGGGDGDGGSGSGATADTPAEPAAQAAPEAAAVSAPEVDTSQVLENNAEATQSRKAGKVNERSKEVARLGLTDEQVERFYAYGTGLQEVLLSAGAEVAGRLLGLAERGVEEVHLTTFFAYAPEIRTKMLSLADDAALANLLAKQYEESWLSGLLSDQNLLALNAADPPGSSPETANLESFLILAEKLRESGNSEVLEELREEGGGSLTEELLWEGEVANRLLTDFTGPGMPGATSLVTGEDALANRFYLDVSSVYGTLEQDALVAGEASFLGGRTIALVGGEYALDALELDSSDALVLGAVEQLRLEGTVRFTGEAGKGKRIVLMSGDELEAEKGLTLEAATNDLVLSVRRDVTLEDAAIRGSREVAVRSLRDLTMRNAEMSASELATLKAAKNLYVDGLNFNKDLPGIVMEATTIRLMNVDFPANAAVNLNSLKGPLDGRYPNFGTNLPAAQELGRVNFLQNVKAGGNLMLDRTTFDQFGKNIVIGKRGSP